MISLDLFENRKYSRKIEKIQNVMGLYSLARSICAMNNEPFAFEDDKDVVEFFGKYEELKTIEDFNINDFPIERLFVEVIPLYKKIKNKKLELNIDIFNIPFDLNNIDSQLPEEIEDTIKEVFVKCFESELKNIDTKNKKLKKIKYNLVIDNLTSQMEEYVQKEEYEQAAIIRDEIKDLE
jgi:UvrB/uvrC motif